MLREKEKGPRRYDRAVERLLSRLQKHSEINVCVCVCVSETLMEI